MLLREIEIDLSINLDRPGVLSRIQEAIDLRISPNVRPLKFAITNSYSSNLRCQVSGLMYRNNIFNDKELSIFDFTYRDTQCSDQFNVVFLVPTGIGAEIGGHAGDAAPASQLISETCDSLILHPNVVNASDINEMPNNSLYVEGSVITRLLMGTIGLGFTRSNRVLTIIDGEAEDAFQNAAVNAVNAARSSYGLNCSRIISLNPAVKMKAAFTQSGTAAGSIDGLERLFDILDDHREEYDAIALSSIICVPKDFHKKYFDSGGDMINPWGGVEAMLTHAVSQKLNLPSAHAPMFESLEVANQYPRIVDPRMAAEAISLTFLQCVLKGLRTSPKIIDDPAKFVNQGVISAADIACLVIPDGCLGLPTLAALEQGITVIAVRENENLMKNDLAALPWRADQFYLVENYWEAAGVLCALRGGIMPSAVRRPLEQTSVEIRSVGQKGELKNPKDHDAKEKESWRKRA